MSLHEDVVLSQQQCGDLWQFLAVISSVRHRSPQIVQSGVQGAHALSLARVNSQARACGIDSGYRTMLDPFVWFIRGLKASFVVVIVVVVVRYGGTRNSSETTPATKHILRGDQWPKPGKLLPPAFTVSEKKTITSTWAERFKSLTVLLRYITATAQGLATCPIKSGSEHKQSVFIHFVKACHKHYINGVDHRWHIGI